MVGDYVPHRVAPQKKNEHSMSIISLNNKTPLYCISPLVLGNIDMKIREGDVTNYTIDVEHANDNALSARLVATPRIGREILDAIKAGTINPNKNIAAYGHYVRNSANEDVFVVRSMENA